MYSQNVDSALVQQVIDVIKDDPSIVIHMYQNEEWLISQVDEDLLKFSEESGFKYQIFDTDNAPNKGIAKIFFTHAGRDHEHLANYENIINQKLGDAVNVAFSTPWCLEVMAAGVSKGEALKAVAESKGFTLANCIAFGDGMNDAEMLSMAGKGLVMGTSHHKVKEALPNNEVIGSNADDAVAHYLHDHLF
jgi:Cof subfamily protein (haloacid dehalogenase superfamily)